MGITLLAMTGAYLAGSINFAIVVFKLLGRADPRTRFSQNPGVTNVYRQAGWPLAALVLVLDMGRAAAVALLAQRFLAPHLVPWMGVGLILGNHFPCLHGFQGGKGVANYLGFCAVLIPLGTGLALLAYGSAFALGRRIRQIGRNPFIASFAMVGVLAIFSLVRWHPYPTAMVAVLITTGLIVWFHRSNIAALTNGGNNES